MRRIAVVFILCALALPGAAQAWTWPVDGPVLRPFSFDHAHPYAAGQHRGVDLAAPAGSNVLAPADGVVSFAGTVPTGGKTVSIQTPSGYTATLVHLGSIAVTRGANVSEGAVVGTVGPSGTVDLSEPYVYFGVRWTADQQGYVDPLTLLPPRAAPAPPAAKSPAVEPSVVVAPAAQTPAVAAAKQVAQPVAEPVIETPTPRISADVPADSSAAPVLPAGVEPAVSVVDEGSAYVHAPGGVASSRPATRLGTEASADRVRQLPRASSRAGELHLAGTARATTAPRQSSDFLPWRTAGAVVAAVVALAVSLAYLLRRRSAVDA